MPTLARLHELQPEITDWRRDLHQHPELLYDTVRTAGIVADKLRGFGCDRVETGIGRTGVVGVIRGRQSHSGKVIGLRADMDALPMTEATGLPHASKNPGLMHACGHDGHTAMLLGAAKYLAESRAFDGTAVVIFQPAEEGGGGGKAMCADGLMANFSIQQIFGMHNMPSLPVGSFAIRPGAFLAASDQFTVTVRGRGGHAARPHETVDPILTAAQLVGALQSIASRNLDPVKTLVVSVTSFRSASDAFNIIPEQVELKGTVRTMEPDVRRLAEEKIKLICAHTAQAYGATATVDYHKGYPVMINAAAQTEFCAAVARQVAGPEHVEANTPAIMGAEDFAYMLEERPGAFIFTGNGETAPVHHPAYDFNDAAIPFGSSYWVKLVETAMPVA
ncbi:MAG: M20 aminoacylase family protein [Opitutales bacterium]